MSKAREGSNPSFCANEPYLPPRGRYGSFYISNGLCCNADSDLLLRQKARLEFSEGTNLKIKFEKMGLEHQSAVMRIFNYYVETGTAAFASKRLPEPFYAILLKKSENYPSYVICDEENKVIGFCQLSAYNPFPTFAQTAELTYFIAPEYTGRGIGSSCLSKLEEDAREIGIVYLLAEVSSENSGSIGFHKAHGFSICGELRGIGHKLDRDFSVVYLQKKL